MYRITVLYFRAQFIEEVREVMGLPEWMLTVDSRKTRTLHGGTCIQFLLHFKGTIVCEIGGSQSGVDEGPGLSVYDAIAISKQLTGVSETLPVSILSVFVIQETATSWTLKMEAASSTDTSVTIYHST
jgi:hypothetical protein